MSGVYPPPQDCPADSEIWRKGVADRLLVLQIMSTPPPKFLDPPLKPWVTKHVKYRLNTKKRAFESNNKNQLRDVQKVLKVELKKARGGYRKKSEHNCQTNDVRKMWTGMNLMSGRTTSEVVEVSPASSPEYINSLNRCFARLDRRNFSWEQERARRALAEAADLGTEEGIVVNADVVAYLSLDKDKLQQSGWAR